MLTWCVAGGYPSSKKDGSERSISPRSIEALLEARESPFNATVAELVSSLAAKLSYIAARFGNGNLAGRKATLGFLDLKPVIEFELKLGASRFA